MAILTEELKQYNLKNDVIFKAFFSRKGNEDFLIDFLNALLKINIKDIKIAGEVFLGQLSVEEKGGRLDIQAELDNKSIINIELQLRNQYNIEKRSTYYAAKMLSKETERGEDYDNIKPVIMINILDYKLLGFDEYVSETITVLKEHRDYEMMRGIKWYFIELPKFRKANPNMNEKLNQWLAFIDDYDRRLVEMAEKKNKTLEKARVEMNYLTGDDEIRRLAELREKWEMDYNSGIANAKEKGFEEGKAEGLSKGMVEGRAEGKAEGMAEGMAEGKAEGMAEGRVEGRIEGRQEGIKQAKIEIAQKLLKLNTCIEDIIKITELSKEEILKIKQRI